jgi:hypothetical protein
MPIKRGAGRGPQGRVCVRERMSAHWALLNARAIELDPHRSGFGAMTSLKSSSLVSMRPSRNCCVICQCDTVAVHLREHERVGQSAQPELDRQRQCVWVVDTLRLVRPTVETHLEARNSIRVALSTKNALKLGAVKDEGTVGEEGGTVGTLCFGYARSCRLDAALNDPPNVGTRNATSCNLAQLSASDVNGYMRRRRRTRTVLFRPPQVAVCLWVP